MNAIAKEWEMFRRSVIPLTASSVQVSEMRKAFYGGVGVAIVMLIDSTKDDSQKDKKDVIQDALTGIMEELTNFAKDVVSERPNSN